MSDPTVPMVKGGAGPKSNSLLTDIPACRRTSAGSIATYWYAQACEPARARDCRSWRSDFVSPSVGTLAHHPSIPVLQSDAPEARLEASDLEAQEV